MRESRQPRGMCRPRNARGLLSVLIAVVYLLAGALHGAHDIDVTTPSGGPELAMMLDTPPSHGDHKAVGGHHCHGCFSLTVTQAAPTAFTIAPLSSALSQAVPQLSGISPDTDSPPPKSLT